MAELYPTARHSGASVLRQPSLVLPHSRLGILVLCGAYAWSLRSYGYTRSKKDRLSTATFSYHQSYHLSKKKTPTFVVARSQESEQNSKGADPSKSVMAPDLNSFRGLILRPSLSNTV